MSTRHMNDLSLAGLHFMLKIESVLIPKSPKSDSVKLDLQKVMWITKERRVDLCGLSGLSLQG